MKEATHPGTSQKTLSCALRIAECYRSAKNIYLKPGEKTDVTPQGKAPLRAVKVGSNFSSRKDIISLSTLRLQLLELLLPENSTKDTTNKQPHYRKVVPNLGPAPEDIDECRNHARFKAVEEAGRRIYMTIAGHRTPQHRHVENHEEESNFISRDTDTEELDDRQSRINASYDTTQISPPSLSRQRPKSIISPEESIADP